MDFLFQLSAWLFKWSVTICFLWGTYYIVPWFTLDSCIFSTPNTLHFVVSRLLVNGKLACFVLRTGSQSEPSLFASISCWLVGVWLQRTSEAFWQLSILLSTSSLSPPETVASRFVRFLLSSMPFPSLPQLNCYLFTISLHRYGTHWRVRSTPSSLISPQLIQLLLPYIINHPLTAILR